MRSPRVLWSAFFVLLGALVAFVLGFLNSIVGWGGRVPNELRMIWKFRAAGVLVALAGALALVAALH